VSNKSKKLDPRVIRTRRFLRQALVSLIHEKSFESIKVKEITERAMLNKATFYLHYRDKEDLLTRSTYELLEELQAQLAIPEDEPMEMSKEKIIDYLTLVFTHFLTHADFYNVILNKIGTPPVISAIQEPIYMMAQQWFIYLRDEDSTPIVNEDVVLSFITSGCMGVLQNWFKQEEMDQPEIVAESIYDILVYGTFRVVGLQMNLETNGMN